MATPPAPDNRLGSQGRRLSTAHPSHRQRSIQPLLPGQRWLPAWAPTVPWATAQVDPNPRARCISDGVNCSFAGLPYRPATSRLVTVRTVDLASDLEAWGGGRPIVELTPKGARQFRFPSGYVLRFDIIYGNNGAHINFEIPGSPFNLHIPVAP